MKSILLEPNKNRLRLQCFIDERYQYVCSYSVEEFGSLEEAKKVASYHQSLILGLSSRMNRHEVREFLGFGPMSSRDYSNIKRPPQGSATMSQTNTNESNTTLDESLKDLSNDHSFRAISNKLASAFEEKEERIRQLSQELITKDAEIIQVKNAFEEKIAAKDKRISELTKVIDNHKAAQELMFEVGSKENTDFKPH